MMSCTRIFAAFVGFAFALAAPAQSLLPASSLPLDSLTAFKNPPASWRVAGGIAGNPRRDRALAVRDGEGILVHLPGPTNADPLATAWNHDDLELDFDFLLTPGAEPAALLQGRHRVNLRDGGRAPGLWQHVRIEFQAARFDAAGKKIRPARFTRIVFNDFTTAQNRELETDTTTGAPATRESAGPLVFDGRGGAFAVRAIRFKRFDAAARVEVRDLAYKFYPGEFPRIGAYDTSAPKSEGAAERFAGDAVEGTGKFALVFTGRLTIPHDGVYAFTSETREPVRLVIDGQIVTETADRVGEAGMIRLTAGIHPFRADFVHASTARPMLEFSVEGPGIAPQTLTATDARSRVAPVRQILLEAKDRVRMQRSFVPFDPKKRLYAVNVGTPAGIHYSYDFETGALLRVWRGTFLDAFDMWENRGEPQTAKPTGPALTLSSKPVIALLERTTHDWPDNPDALYSSQGYRLEPDGQPVFLFTLAGLTGTDRIAPSADGIGLTRTLTLKGRTASWEAWILLAEGSTITAQPDASGYIVGDRAYYIDLPAGSALRPIIRTRNGRQQLAVPVQGPALTAPIVYSLIW